MHLAAEAQFEPKKRKKAHEAKQEPAEEAEFKQRERKPSVKRQAVQDEEAERGTKKRHKAPDSQKAPPAAQSQKAPPEAESQKAQPEAESAAQKPAQEAACSASGHKRDNGADSLDSIEHEKQLAWKKEKRRKQNREAQRRRRDRLMNQHRQKQAEMDGGSGGDLQGIGGPIINGQSAYMMMAGGGVGGMELFNAANGMQTGKDEFGNLNMAMRYAGDLGAGGQLQSNVSMLQKQLSFGGGGMHPWANYNAAMQGNMLGQGLSAYGQVQIFSLYDNIL